MDAEVSSTADSDVQRLIIWLEEQRRADHDRLVQLTRAVEQLRDEVREHGTVVAQLVENESKREDDALAEAIVQLRDHLALVERSLGDHIDASIRAEQMQTAQRERDLRQLSDLAQQVIALDRASEAMTGRMAAFAEEMKRARDERALVGQVVDELQRTQAALQNRLAVADEVTRRFSTFQSVSEQTSERHQNELARLDSQFKLLDLRFTRELTEIRHNTDELIARSEERLRPIVDLTRQVNALVEQGDAVDHRIDSLVRDVEAMNADLGRIDAQGKVDRGTLKRISETVEAQGQHVNGVSALVWQLVERVDSVTRGLEDLRIELDSVVRRTEEAERRLVRLEEERARLGSELAEVARELRADHHDTENEPVPLADRVSSEIASLRSQVQVIQVLAIQHLRRTVEELQQQLRELEEHQS